jgi:hypothetical protein
MKYTIEESYYPGSAVVTIAGGEQWWSKHAWSEPWWSKHAITTILDILFNMGADQVMLANSRIMQNWTFQVIAWAQQPDAVVNYIHARVRFDQIFCQTMAQAEQVVKNLEQMDVYWALQRDYTHD